MVFLMRLIFTIPTLLTFSSVVLANKPIITPSNDFATAGKEFNITCNTSASVPYVIWKRGVVYIKHMLLSCSGEDAINQNQNRSQLYRYYCASNRSFTLSIPGSVILQEHASKWTCDYGDVSEPFQINVYHAANQKPQITGYNNLQDIREGERINLTCTVSGGYPLTSLAWTCDGSLMDVVNQSSEGVAKILLPLSINRTLHGVQCVCNGTSLANYSGSSNVTFKVNYPPSVTLIYKKEKNSNTTNYNLYCQVDDGNPSKYAISWSHTFSKRVVRTNQDLSNLQSNNGHNLTLRGASYQDIGEYTCSIHNNVTDLNGNLLQNKSVTIERNFSAVFSPANDKVFNAVYGKTFNVRIPFYCQPAINNIGDLLWFKKENKEQLLYQTNDLTFGIGTVYVEIQFYQTSIRVDGQVAIMNIKKVSNTSQGNFVLKVRNMEDVYESFDFKIEVKEEMKEPATTGTSTIDPEQKSSLPLIIGCVVAAIIIVAVVVVVVVLYMIRKRKFNQDKDEKQRLSKNTAGNRELYRESNPYAEVTEPYANIQTARPYSNPYSEPNIGQLALNNDINTTSKNKQYYLPMAEIPLYAVTGSVQKPCTDPVNSRSAQKDDTNAENKPVPIYAEVNKPKKNVNTNSELGAAKDSSDSQKDDSNKVKKSEPVYSEVKKPKPIEKKDEALDSKDQTEQVDEEGAAKHSYDSQKGDIKKPDPVNSEAKKPKPSEKKDEALDSKDQTEQDLIVAENNKFIDAVDQDGNRPDSRSGVVPNSTSLSTVNDTVLECEGETKNELNYVELDLSQQSDQKSEIISKEEKVEYAEVNTMA